MASISCQADGGEKLVWTRLDFLRCISCQADREKLVWTESSASCAVFLAKRVEGSNSGGSTKLEAIEELKELETIENKKFG